MATPLVTNKDFIQSLQKSLPASASTFFAFFSSVTGGIVTDPSLMVVPMDDHMVHRGHAVFDTANIWDGKAYGISFHLDRLMKSAKQARIPVPYTKDELKKIILHTAAASQQRDGVMIRYWLSVGRGGFGISPTECKGQSNFFVMIHKWTPKLETGVKEYTVSVPLKPPFLATMKTTNYLLNALAAMQSEEKGGYIGIWVDEKGMIAEASVSCLGFLGQDGVLRTPNFDEILAGTTIIRALELYGKEHPIKQGPVSAAEARKSKEIIIFGGGGSVAVTHWDNVPIGDGKPGPIYRKINELLVNDLKQSEHLDDIPYNLYPARIVSKL